MTCSGFTFLSSTFGVPALSFDWKLVEISGKIICSNIVNICIMHICIIFLASRSVLHIKKRKEVSYKVGPGNLGPIFSSLNRTHNRSR